MNKALVLPISAGECEIGPLGLTLDKNLPYERWAKLGKALLEINQAVQWYIGDWLAQGEIIYGETYAQAAGELGIKEERLMALKYVAGRFPFPRRKPHPLTWTHHALVAALEPVEGDRLLEKALINGWTTAELRNEVPRNKTATSEPEIMEPPGVLPSDDSALAPVSDLTIIACWARRLIETRSSKTRIACQDMLRDALAREPVVKWLEKLR